MAHLAGKAGDVFASGTTTGTETVGMKSWTLDYTVDTLETTDFDDAGNKTYITGCKGWSGSFEGYKDGIPVASLVGAVITLTLKETQTSTEKWVGEAFITGIHVNTSFDGIVSYAYDFQGTGAITTIPTS